MITSFFGPGKGPVPPTDGADAAARFAQIAQIRTYWEALRDGPALPRRATINPRGIEGALSNAFLIERVAIGLARFRIAGMHLSDLMGMDVRGMPLSSLFEPAARTGLGLALEEMFASPAILEMSLEAERGLGRPALEARLLLLPLATSPGEPALALGGLVSAGQIGRSPRRFVIARRHLSPILHAPTRQAPAAGPVSVVQPALVAVPLPAARLRAFAESASPFTAPGPKPLRAKPGRAHLRLVKSD